MNIKANPNATNSEMESKTMSVINDRLDFLSEVLQDFCTLHNLEYLSADDLLYDPSNELTDYQRDWLIGYCQTWDIIQEAE